MNLKPAQPNSAQEASYDKRLQSAGKMQKMPLQQKAPRRISRKVASAPPERTGGGASGGGEIELHAFSLDWHFFRFLL